MDNKPVHTWTLPFRIGFRDYLRWLWNPRMIIFLAMMYFVTDYAISPLIEHSQAMGQPLQAYETFLAITNSLQLSVVMPCVFLILMGDFPRIDENARLYLFRTGRITWLGGQLITAVLAALTFAGATFGMTILLCAGHITMEDQWSDVVTRYYLAFPDSKDNYVTNFIPGELYNNFTPSQALFYTFTLLAVYLVLLCLIQLVCRLVSERVSGLVVGGGIIAIGGALNVTEIKVKWLFPAAHALEWQHCDLILKRMEVSMTQSYLYFGVLCCILIFAAIYLTDRMRY